MFKNLSLILAFVISLASHANESSKCSDPNDRYMPAGFISQGDYQGSCINTETQRSFRIINGAEIGHPDTLTIANISHKDDFWIGVFPKDNAIAHVVFQEERFPPEWIAAHTQLRFIFSKPIKLINQNDNSQTDFISDIVFSIEATPIVGGPSYDLIGATKGNFAGTHRLVSLEDKINHMIHFHGHTVKQWLLKMDAHTIDRLWRTILTKAHDPEMTAIYHTIYYNCTNKLFELIDYAIGKRNRLHTRMLTTLPILSEGVLNERRLIEYRTHDLNDEITQ